MRVLFITNYHQLYGANRSLLSIIENLKNNGHEVCLILPRKGDYSQELERKGIDHMVIPYFSQLFYYKKALPYLALPFLAFFTLCMMPYIIYKAKKFNPDLVYSNTAAENIGYFVARSIGAKHLTHVREFMDLDHSCVFFGGNAEKKKFICKSDAVLYVSEAVANHTLMGEPVVGKHKVIYNGVKMGNEPYKEKKLPTAINFGVVGLIDESKGQDLAIRYFNEIKDLYPGSLLHIWGDKEGGYKKMIYKMVEDLKLQDRVIFHGFEKNTEKIYGDMSVLLMCSRAEGFGRVTVEAMAKGIPVLGYRSGGTAELVIDGYNGYSFKSQEEFNVGVANMFNSNEHYNDLCHQAYNHAHENFTEDIYTRKVRNFVESTFKF